MTADLTLAKVAMAIIIAFTDPGVGQPLRHAVSGSPGRPQGPRRTRRIKPGGHPPGRPGPGPGRPPAPAA